jgi:hypothetical protein
MYIYVKLYSYIYIYIFQLDPPYGSLNGYLNIPQLLLGLGLHNPLQGLRRRPLSPLRWQLQAAECAGKAALQRFQSLWHK